MRRNLLAFAFVAAASTSHAAWTARASANGCWTASDGSGVQCCPQMKEPRPAACAAHSAGVTGASGGSSSGAGITTGAKTAPSVGAAKAAAADAGGVASGETSGGVSGGSTAVSGSGLMNRAPYVGTATQPCRWGPPTGRCTHEGGQPLPPPPGPPSSFKVVSVGALPFYGATNHIAFPLTDQKLAIRFIARPFTFPFQVHFDSPNGFVAKSAMEMFVAISEKPGDFDVPSECLVTPDMLANGWAGGAAHSVADIPVIVLAANASPAEVQSTTIGRCVLKGDGRSYYVNVAGDCSAYWMQNDAAGLAAGRQAGCVTDMVNVNGWMAILAPGGMQEFCASKGFRVRSDGLACE